MKGEEGASPKAIRDFFFDGWFFVLNSRFFWLLEASMDSRLPFFAKSFEGRVAGRLDSRLRGNDVGLRGNDVGLGGNDGGLGGDGCGL